MKKKLMTTLMALVLSLSLAMPAFAYSEYGLLYDATDPRDQGSLRPLLDVRR